MRARRIVQRAGALVGALGLSVTALGAVQLATTGSAAAAGNPMLYSPETSPVGVPPINTQTYVPPNGTLTPTCPNAIADTPGSDPASNAINTMAGLTPPNSTEAGGTIHYIFNDNGKIGASFDIQVCQVSYPAGTFTAADFNPDGSFAVNVSKATLNTGTQIDGAQLTGTVASAGNVYYEWTFDPTKITTVNTGDWICQYARDINDAHSGGGNRKAAPVCFQVTAPLLQVTKTGPANASVGDNVVYTVDVTNNNPAGATGIETEAVTLSDPTPTNLTFVSETNPGAPWVCTDPPVPPGTGTLSCTKPASTSPPTMTVGETDEFTITYTVGAGAAGGSVTNTATASSSDGGTAHGSATTNVAAAGVAVDPALTISKSATSTSVSAVGGEAEYTITVVSTAGKTAAGAPVVPQMSVTDTLPAGTWTIKSQTFPGAPCSINPAGTTLTCTEASLAAGTYNVVIHSPTGAAMCPSIANAATVSSTTANTDISPAGPPKGQTAPATINLTGCAPAVALDKSADHASVTLGNPVSFLITAAVTGAQPAGNLVITDNLPTNTGSWAINSAALPAGDVAFPTACTIAGAVGSQVLTCNEASLAGTTVANPAGTTYAVDVVATASTAGCASVTNTASATLGTGTLSGSPTTPVSTTVSGCGGGGPVPNNPTTTTTTTTTTIACPAPGVPGPNGTCVEGESLTPDPQITKTPDASSVSNGQPIGFTITLSNPGTADTQATISDPLPTNPGLSWSIDKQPANGPTCSISNGTLTCGPANLAVGASWSVHIISPTTAGTCGPVNNTASVSSPNLATPRSASATETVTCVLGVTLSAPPPVATPVKNLPFTGANTARLLSLGATSALIGAFLMLLGRRRPEDELVPVTAEDPLGRM